MKKKMISLLLTIALASSLLLVPVGATRSSDINDAPTLTVANGIRTAVSRDSTLEYTVIYNQPNNTISVSVRNLRDNSVRSSGELTIPYTASSSPCRLFIEQDTMFGFYYGIKTGTTFEWELQRPKTDAEGESGRYYFKVWENASNRNELDVFKTEVDDLYSKQVTLIADTSNALFSAFASGILAAFAATTGVLSDAAINTVILAVGVGTNAVKDYRLAGNQCNSCFLAIERVFYASDNRHY